MAAKVIHEGRNLKRLREILGYSQDVLVTGLGLSQQAISQLESKEKIDPKILEDVAKILKIPVEAIKNFDDQAAVNVISSTFNDNASVNSNCILNINPVEKWLEALEENKRLYEALLKSEREKVAMLEKMLNKK
jgi:transcriptional regulator with XRE-family HTH domain